MTRQMKKREEREGKKDAVSSSKRVTRSSGGDGGPEHSRDKHRKFFVPTTRKFVSNGATIVKPNCLRKTKIQEKSVKMKGEGDKYISVTTGLTVVSVSSSNPHYLFSMKDRAKIARILPEVVLINSCGKDERLILGVDYSPQELSNKIHSLEEELETLTFSLVDVSSQDPFSYLEGSASIPRVDKTGIYQIIVDLSGLQGRCNTKQALTTLTKKLKIVKTVEDEGKTILQVSHVLEYIMFSDCISQEFSLEMGNVWQTKPVGKFENRNIEGVNRYFWVRVNDAQLNDLSPSSKQFNLYTRLNEFGGVVQLEQDSFGVKGSFLAVFSGSLKLDIAGAGSDFNFQELFPGFLPDSNIPTYGVDRHGFYSISGKFPQNLSTNVRKKFTSDMKEMGAVGFRSGESENDFSLHFVTSKSIEEVRGLTQYSNLNLRIEAPLVRKPSFEKATVKLVPSIWRPKDDRMKARSSRSRGNSVAAAPAAYQGDPQRIKEGIGLDETLNSKSEVSSDDGKEAKLPSDSKSRSIGGQTKPSVPCYFTEAELFNINWQQGKTLVNSLKSLAKFLASAGVMNVEEQQESSQVRFRIADKKKFIKILKIYSRNETNSFDKLRAASPRLVISGNKFNKGMFGLTIMKRNDEREAIKKIRANYPGSKIEERSQVRIIWLQNKLDYFKILTDKNLNLNLVPSIQNYTEGSKESRANPGKQDVNLPSAALATKVRNQKKDRKNSKDRSKMEELKMSEREVFGFIWRNLDEDSTIRDEQVVSRQLTEFIRNIKGCRITNNEDDGLVFHFSKREDFINVLSKYCPQFIGAPERFASLTRKFTMIPSRGNYGIFSVKRIRQSDFSKIGSFKLHNNTLWFNDKLDVIKALRDPTIRHHYPAIYIDCRNIFILQNIRPQSSPLKTFHRNFNTNFARGFTSRQVMSVAYQEPMRRDQNMRDPAIIRAVALGHNHHHSNSLLSQLLSTNLHSSSCQQVASFKYDFMLGKFGVLPSNRMIKNGYKMYKKPYNTKHIVNTELFLEGKDEYRNKKVEDAADDIKSILSGSDTKLQTSLKDIKMRRVELFLKERLGVETAGGNSKGDIFLSIIEGDSMEAGKRFEDVTELPTEMEEAVFEALRPDARGFYTLSIPFDPQDPQLSTNLEEDISWYEVPVSVLPIVDPIGGSSLLEIQMKNKDLVIAAYSGLKDKYPGLKIDKTGGCRDIYPDRRTGLYTLAYQDKSNLRYAGILERFIQYCSDPRILPVIKKGESPQLVLVGFKKKEDALCALRGLDEVTVASSSRS